MITNNKEVSAGVIIYRHTSEGPKFLILYNGGPYWNFPKGKLTEGERSFRAALREVWEETGLGAQDLKISDRFRVEDKFTYVRNRQKIFKTVTYYLAETAKPFIRLDIKPENVPGEKHQGYGWFLYKDALRILKAPNLKNSLRKAYALISGRNISRPPAVPKK
ncbi:MAG: NUDIX domain-containing protein [Minisyncoccia bacterium]